MKSNIVIGIIALAFISLAAAAVNQDVEGRIIGGSDTEPHQFPFICSMQYAAANNTFRHTCGSTVLNENWILTAAHCLRDPVIYENYQIACGKWDLSTFEDGQQLMSIDRVIIHEVYANGTIPDNLPYDMALLHLAEPLVLSETVVPTILPTADEFWYPNGTIIGWGIYQFDENDTGILPDILQSTEVTIITDDECYAVTNDWITIFENFICTGPLSGGMAGCNGDSGGPMVTEINGRLVQIGVASWAIRPCGAVNAPTGYVSTQVFIDWIRDNMD